METLDFATKTLMMRRNDTNPKGSYVVGIDIGYSSVKVMSANIVGMFPSFAIPDQNLGVIGTPSDDYIRYTNLTTGEKWFVGKMALDLIQDDDTNLTESTLYRRDRYDDPLFKIILETGLGMSCMYDTEYTYKTNEFKIETGLPPKYNTKSSYDKTALISLFGGEHHFSLQIGSKNPIEFHLTINPKNVHILDQPMGTLYSVITTNDHTPTMDAELYLNQNVLIFDGGFGTLDLFPIKSHVLQENQTFSNLGMKRVIEDTADTIREQFGKDVSVPAMQKYLQSGSIRTFDKRNYSTKNEPIAQIVEECSKKICEEAIEKLNQVYPLYEYDHLIVTGGTGAAWFDQIAERLKGMESLAITRGTLNDELPGVFSNVRGYYMFGYDMQRMG